MGDDLQEVARWVGPGGIRVRVVRLAGAHGLWAAWAGVPPEVVATCLITKRGALYGPGYVASLAELVDVVDLAELDPE